MVQLFCKGKLIKEIAEIFECDSDTVRKALLNSDIQDTRKNQYEKNKKAIAMLDKNNLNVIKNFSKIEEAAQYMLDNGIASGTLRSAAAAIGRVVNGQRASAYGYKWRLI